MRAVWIGKKSTCATRPPQARRKTMPQNQQTDIVVLLPVNTEQRRILEQAAPQAVFHYLPETGLDAGQQQLLRQASIIVGNPPPALLKDCPRLGLLQLQSAGTNAYLDGVLPPGCRLANATGAYGLAISEHMLGVLLQIYKKLADYRDSQHRCQWKDAGTVKSVYGATVLIVGLGDIGGEFAKRVKALGAYTIGLRRQDLRKPDYLDELHLSNKLEELLPRADVVALCLPETAQTKGLIGRRQLALLQPEAVVLNVGRGSAIDTEALCDALEATPTLFAGLDVTDPEPLPPDHRLWRLKNAFITPHVSGGHHLPETFARIVQISAHNIQAYLDGRPLRSEVDFSTGYRSL